MKKKEKAKKHYNFIKEKIKEAAIYWQSKFEENENSYKSISEMQAHFAKLAKKYGLIKEFKENGII